jgi:hypothetical protein
LDHENEQLRNIFFSEDEISLFVIHIIRKIIVFTHLSSSSSSSSWHDSQEFDFVQRVMENRPSCRLPCNNRRSDESRTTASALNLSCYIVDDVMVYTEYSLIILSHIVLTKFSITSREIF